MNPILLYPAGSTDAIRYCTRFLRQKGIPLVDHPTPEVTHLLLDIPSFLADGSLRSGLDAGQLLRMLPERITIIGGNLYAPCLAEKKTIDLLLDENYLAQNAAITADCALRTAGEHLVTTFADSPTLVIGWGRIGKCLSLMLKALGVNVTIAARNEKDRAMAQSLGFTAVSIDQIPAVLSAQRLIFNTVPETILSEFQLSLSRECVKIDLASKPGLEGNDVFQARGLPGRVTPESSGKLIAQTILKRIKEGSI